MKEKAKCLWVSFNDDVSNVLVEGELFISHGVSHIVASFVFPLFLFVFELLDHVY